MTEKDLEIQRLRQELAEKSRIIQEQGAYIAGELVPEREAKLGAELERMKHNRDMAVLDLYGVVGSECSLCKDYTNKWVSAGRMDEHCSICISTNKCDWVWRGFKEG